MKTMYTVLLLAITAAVLAGCRSRTEVDKSNTPVDVQEAPEPAPKLNPGDIQFK